MNDLKITFVDSRLCQIIPNGYIDNQPCFIGNQSFSQCFCFTQISQNLFGNNNICRFNLFNSTLHNQMQQLNQVTNNYMLQIDNKYNQYEEDMKVADLW